MTATVEYLYPPRWLDGTWAEKTGQRTVTVQLSGKFTDGTNETDVVKVHLSNLKNTMGAVPSRTAIEHIQWHVSGVTVFLEWDRAPHAPIYTFNLDSTEDTGNTDFMHIGGRVDPGEDDGTGDIILTTENADAGDSYEITMRIRLKG